MNEMLKSMSVAASGLQAQGTRLRVNAFDHLNGFGLAARIIRERVPTLDETLDLTLGKVRLYLEIKDPLAALSALRIIRERRCQSHVMLASFDIELMRGLGEEVRDTELGLILGNATFHPMVRWREAFPWLAFRRVNYQVLCMRVEICYGYLAGRARTNCKKLYVWTADREKQFARMTAIGVDGIVTNTPDRLIAYLNHQSDNRD